MNLSLDQINELKAMVITSMQNLYTLDISLIERQANERSIAFRFGLYFSEALKSSSFGEDFALTVDFDYNRNLDQVKNMEGFNVTHGVYPDIILHHRGYNDKKILVLDFKGIWNKSVKARNDDFRKLVEFTHPERNDYHFGLGTLIDLGYDLNGCNLPYFLNGEIS